MTQAQELDLALDLGLTPRSATQRGRAPLPLQVSFARELKQEELVLAPAIVQKSPPIKRLRDSHHALARVLATGVTEHEAALVTGYSASRISILKADPQFQELLEFYRTSGTELVADLRLRMANMGLDALAELSDRLNENPEDFSSALLKDLVREMADRTGHAPQRGPTSVTQVNVNLGERMARARERAALAAPQKSVPIDLDLTPGSEG